MGEYWIHHFIWTHLAETGDIYITLNVLCAQMGGVMQTGTIS